MPALENLKIFSIAWISYRLCLLLRANFDNIFPNSIRGILSSAATRGWFGVLPLPPKKKNLILVASPKTTITTLAVHRETVRLAIRCLNLFVERQNALNFSSGGSTSLMIGTRGIFKTSSEENIRHGTLAVFERRYDVFLNSRYFGSDFTPALEYSGKDAVTTLRLLRKLLFCVTFQCSQNPKATENLCPLKMCFVVTN